MLSLPSAFFGFEESRADSISVSVRSGHSHFDQLGVVAFLVGIGISMRSGDNELSFQVLQRGRVALGALVKAVRRRYAQRDRDA